MKKPASSWWLRWRWRVQLASTVALNSYFLTGAKGVCAPALNCWACPAAITSCPLGAMQNAAGLARLDPQAGGAALAYALGAMLALGAVLGRFMCGWLCPFGWLQDLLARLSRRKLRLPAWTGYLRYAFLVGLVLVVPYFTTVAWFSKVCPQGALQGGLLQPLLNPGLRASIGTLWYLKQVMLLGWLVAFVFLRRPFCRLMCPLGAIFGLFYRVSLWQIRVDPYRCVNCGWCEQVCPAGLDPSRHAHNSTLCLSCLECTACPHEAITTGPIWRLGATQPPPEAGTEPALKNV